MHFHQDWLPWLEKRLRPAERQRAEAHLADCAVCRADLAETRDLVDALAVIPQALEALPWRKAQLWPGIRAGLQCRPAVYGTWRWATGVSLGLLLMLFSGAWWGAASASPLAATAGRVYLARPVGPAQLPATPLETMYPRLASLYSGQMTATPLPAPVQTPSFSGMIVTSTVAPGS